MDDKTIEEAAYSSALAAVIYRTWPLHSKHRLRSTERDFTTRKVHATCSCEAFFIVSDKDSRRVKLREKHLGDDLYMRHAQQMGFSRLSLAYMVGNPVFTSEMQASSEQFQRILSDSLAPWDVWKKSVGPPLHAPSMGWFSVLCVALSPTGRSDYMRRELERLAESRRAPSGWDPE